MDYKKVVVAGGGVSGSQIAFQVAYCGYDVTVLLKSEDSIERAKPQFEKLKNIYLNTFEQMKSNPRIYCRGLTEELGLSEEKIDKLEEQVQKGFDNLKFTTSYDEAGSDADLVIEAITENMDAKIEFYKELSKHLPEKTVIVTNTSTLLPSKLAPYTGRAEKYLALHFANNLWIYDTAEVMGHDKTEEKYYDEIVEFAQSINMVALKIKKEQPGYMLSSMLVPFLNAAEGLCANEVADPEIIDLTWKLATGAQTGPFQMIDAIGLKTAYEIIMMEPEIENPESTPAKIAALLKEKIDEGKTGMSAGEGFYKYQ